MVLKQDSDLAELRKRIRHSAAHVMADVVTRMFPEAKTGNRTAHGGRLLLRLPLS